MLGICEGLRIGEICALKWKDFDLRRHVINVHETLQRVYDVNKNKTQVIITSAKTESSIREIPISQRVLKFLERLPQKQKDAFILTNTEKFIEPRNFRKYYTKICTIQEIDNRKFHTLRHTFATKCIETGINSKVVSEILGHSSVNTTLNLYVHPTMEEKEKNLNLLKF